MNFDLILILFHYGKMYPVCCTHDTDFLNVQLSGINYIHTAVPTSHHPSLEFPLPQLKVPTC